jgi:hypothetical protein
MASWEDDQRSEGHNSASLIGEDAAASIQKEEQQMLQASQCRCSPEPPLKETNSTMKLTKIASKTMQHYSKASKTH